MISRSDISLWKKGLQKCDSCSKDFPFDEGHGLEMSRCPHCGAGNFTPLKISSFYLFAPLGGGGMGAVYKAFSEDISCICAVKILPRAKRNDHEFIKNLLAEISAAERFGSHPNLPRLISAGDCGGEHFMACEFIEGERLDRLVESRKQLTEREALSIMKQILEAEKHIRNCGYLFRDLKPENIIVSKDSKVKLFDYGLCLELTKLSASVQERSDQLEGSPFYLPPERIVGASEGEYSEIYSMGMLFFFMLSGRTYYSESEINDLVVKHLTAIRIVSAAHHLRGFHSKTISTIDRMIQRNPNSRHPDFASLEKSLDEIGEELDKDISKQGHTGGIPSLVHMEAATPKLKLPNKKTIYAFGLAMIVLLASMLVYFTVSSIMKSIAERERRNALLIETAKELGIPPDVPEPDMSEPEIRKLADEKCAERMAEIMKSIMPFDEAEETKKICASLGIGQFARKKPDKTIKELKSEIQRQIKAQSEAESSRRIKHFDEPETRRIIEKELGFDQKQVLTPKPLDAAENEFKTFIKTKSEEKFGVKVLASKLQKVHEDFSPYKKGETLKFKLSSGQSVEGPFAADLGDKILLGSREVRKKDIMDGELWRLNEEICSKKISQETAKCRQDFYKEKKDFTDNFEKSGKEVFMKERGYYLSNGSRWLSAEDLLAERTAAAKSEHEKKNAETQKKIQKEVREKFDEDAFFTANGYRKIGGEWISELDAVHEELSLRRKKYEESTKRELEESRRKTEDFYTSEIFKKHYYIFFDGSWRPAKSLLETLVLERMKNSDQKKAKAP